MTVFDRYRPTTLAEIVGQPNPTRALAALAARPRSCCVLLEGPGGVGKSASALALATELGCFADPWRDLCRIVPAATLTTENVKTLLSGDSPFRFATPGYQVLLLEELEQCHPQVARLLKVFLDRDNPDSALSRFRLIVAATSNDASGLDGPLKQRFGRPLTYSGGPEFAAACMERLVEIWQTETGEECLPPGAEGWGWVDGGASFSMRIALDTLLTTIESLEVA